MEEPIEILLKSKLCVFCALPVLSEVNEDDPDAEVPVDPKKAAPISENTFLQGISVLCEVMKMEEDLKRFFGNPEEFALFGREDFVRFVCCKMCGGLLDKIVSMHQLILLTQASLNENVQKMEGLIVESERRIIEGESPEYSINACVLFREKILQHVSRVASESPGVRKAQPRKTTSRARPRISKPTKSTDPVVTPTQSNLSLAPFVKLERLTLSPANEPHREDLPDNLEELVPNDLESYNSNDDANNSEAWSPMQLEMDPLENDKEDDDYRPVRKRRRGKGYTKRGRPRIHPKVEKVPGKRGRPPKPRSEEDDKTPRKRGRPPKIRSEESDETPRRRRKKISKVKTQAVDENEKLDNAKETPIRVTDSDSHAKAAPKTESGHTWNEDDMKGYFTSDDNTRDHDEDFKPKSSRSRNKRSKMLTARSRKILSKAGHSKPPEKKRAGRPRTRNHPHPILHDNGPTNHRKPIYVLDSQNNMFMYFNCKFQKSPYGLRCLHPECSHIEPLPGYFTDEEAFHKFRVHVRYKHRHRHIKISDDDTENYFYCCHLCDAQLDSRDALTDHHTSVHAGIEIETPPVLCEICGNTLNHDEIIFHKLSHKSDEEKKRKKPDPMSKNTPKPLFFPCDECGKPFKTRVELRLHKPIHLPLESRRQFICDICGAGYVTQGSLYVHTRRVHLKNLATPHVCRICNRKYTNLEKDKYEDHMRAHTGVKPFQCATCGKSFHVKYSLKVHEKLHIDTGGVSCEFCPNVYKNEKYLKKHLRKHHPDKVQLPNYEETKKYKIPEQRDDFIGPRQRFPCEPCGHQYIYKSMLISHLKGKHNMKLANGQDYPVMWTMEDQYGFKNDCC